MWPPWISRDLKAGALPCRADFKNFPPIDCERAWLPVNSPVFLEICRAAALRGPQISRNSQVSRRLESIDQAALIPMATLPLPAAVFTHHARETGAMQ